MISLLFSLLFAQEDFPPKFVVARETSRALHLPQRIEVISESLLGIPYKLSPEGEGNGFDPDPLQNFAHMDCLTYVETVLSFSMSETWDEAMDVRNDLRYLEDEIHYENRKHFMFSQWIPSNLDLGYIQDITSQIGPSTHVSRVFDENLWKNWRGRRKIPLQEHMYPTGDFGIDVLPISEAVKYTESIPSGSIVVVVLETREGYPVMVSHVGFVIDVPKAKGGVVKKMRHATTIGKIDKIKEHSLKWYFKHLRDYPHRRKIFGIAVFYPKYPNDEDIVLSELLHGKMR